MGLVVREASNGVIQVGEHGLQTPVAAKGAHRQPHLPARRESVGITCTAKTQILRCLRHLWSQLSSCPQRHIMHNGPSLRAAQDRQCPSGWTRTVWETARSSSQKAKVCCSTQGGRRTSCSNAAFQDSLSPHRNQRGWFTPGKPLRNAVTGRSAGSSKRMRYCPMQPKAVAEQNVQQRQAGVGLSHRQPGASSNCGLCCVNRMPLSERPDDHLVDQRVWTSATCCTPSAP